MTSQEYFDKVIKPICDKALEKKKEVRSVAKQIIQVGVAVATDGVMPGKDNILNVSACLGDSFLFEQNVAPVDGTYHESAFWTKHPDELIQLKKGTVPLPTAMATFAKWLDQWQGRMVAICSILDYWHLFSAMQTHTGGCAFGTLPLDPGTWYCAKAGTKAPGKITDKIRPLDVAKERWHMVTEGAMPNFGSSKKTSKATKDWRDPGGYVDFLQRAREAIQPTQPAANRWQIRANQPPQNLQQAAQQLANRPVDYFMVDEQLLAPMERQ